METDPPVALKAQVKAYLASGGWLEVECEKTVVKEGSVFGGRWVFCLKRKKPDGKIHHSPVVVWKDLQPKVIRTVNGLMAFAIDLDVAAPSFPRIKGEIGVWRVVENKGSKKT